MFSRGLENFPASSHSLCIFLISLMFFQKSGLFTFPTLKQSVIGWHSESAGLPSAVLHPLMKHRSASPVQSMKAFAENSITPDFVTKDTDSMWFSLLFTPHSVAWNSTSTPSFVIFLSRSSFSFSSRKCWSLLSLSFSLSSRTSSRNIPRLR